MRARYYDQTAGIFGRVDPFFGYKGIPQSFNDYAYAHGDPITNADPTGQTILAHQYFRLSLKLLKTPAIAKLLSSIGVPLVVMSILVGIAAHQKIGQLYKIDHGNRSNIFTNRAIGTILQLPAGSIPDLQYFRPDIADLGFKHIYEIKPVFGGTSAALGQMNQYIGILNEIDPNVLSNDPMTPEGEQWLPGIGWPVNVHNPIVIGPPEFPYIPPTSIYADLIEPGVILYYPGAEFYLYVAALTLAVKAAQKVAIDTARFARQLHAAHLIALFGVL